MAEFKPSDVDPAFPGSTGSEEVAMTRTLIMTILVKKGDSWDGTFTGEELVTEAAQVMPRMLRRNLLAMVAMSQSIAGGLMVLGVAGWIEEAGLNEYQEPIFRFTAEGVKYHEKYRRK